MTTQDLIKQIELQNDQITNQVLTDLLNENIPIAQGKYNLYKGYLGEVPIKTRTFDDANKINNKLVNDFRGEIVDQVVGYLYGNPVNYMVEDDGTNEALSEFLMRNRITDLDYQTGFLTAICGYSGRLLYIDSQGKERVMNLNPWEYFIVKDQSLDETQYACRWYPIEITKDNKKTYKIKLEWYDKKNITFYVADTNSLAMDYFNNNIYITNNSTTNLTYTLNTSTSQFFVNNFTRDTDEEVNPRPHLFSKVPVIHFQNNHTEQGDFEKVEALIDAYDKAISDEQNEVEEFRLAYLMFWGGEIDSSTMIAARQTGAFGFPDKDTGAEFLTKNINDVFLENHKKTLKDNIYRFSKTVDMSDEKFSGSNESGESRKWKLIGLENKAKVKEVKFIKACKDMFDVLSTAWSLKGVGLNAEDITIQLTRNLPVELITAGDIAQKFKGIISDKTLLSLLPFIPDVQAELDQIAEENNDKVNLDNYDMPNNMPEEDMTQDDTANE